MIFQRVLDARPYPEPKLTNDQWGELAPRQIRLAELSTTRSTLDLNALLASDSTFFGDLFAHVVRFKGELYRAAKWPHQEVSYAGKRVGIIGTGSSGMQMTPEIARDAAHLVVFQRTANYSVPAHNAPLTAEFRQWVKDHFDEIRTVMHSNTNGHAFTIEDRSAFDVTDEERAVTQALSEAAQA